MRPFLVYPALLLAFGSCATATVDHQELAQRLEALPERPSLVGAKSRQETVEETSSGQSSLPDVRGDVVMILGDRVAVRLDADSELVPRDRVYSMGLHSRAGYAGELMIVQTYDGHVLGRVIGRWRRQVEVGDRASCRTP